MTSLREALPAGYDPTKGIRNLRVRDTQPVSARSMTSLVFADRNFPDISAGHVYASRLQLRVFGDGRWWFGGHLDDTSVLSGDNYAIGFSFEDGGFAGIKTGELGADETSTPQHIKFAIEGRSEGLQRNFFQVLQSNVKARLHRSLDLEQALSDIWEDLKWLGRQIEIGVSASSSDPCPPVYNGEDNGGDCGDNG